METTSVLVLANIILTAVVGIVSSTRFKCRFGRGKSISIAPKDAPASPDSVDPAATPEVRERQKAKERAMELAVAESAKERQDQERMVREFVALEVPRALSRAPTPIPRGMPAPMTPEEMV